MLPDAVHTVIFSSEHCSHRIQSVGEALKLKHFLSHFFSEIRILAYLRRQDEYMVSHYSTRLRHGNFTGIELFPFSEDDVVLRSNNSGGSNSDPVVDLDKKNNKHGLDWAAMLDIWRSAFGRDQVMVRIFDRRNFRGGDLLLDFQCACGIPPVLPSTVPAVNTSLVPEAQEFLRQLNVARHEFAKDNLHLPLIPPAVRRALNAQYSGRGRLPSRAQAISFFERYRESNECLRVEYFPDQPTAFIEDFSHYPETADPVPGDADVLRVALNMLIAVGSDIRAEAAPLVRKVKQGNTNATQDARRGVRGAKRAARRAPSDAATYQPPRSGE